MSENILCCPSCKSAISIKKEADHILCAGCGFKISVVSGIPLLVKDAGAVERMIKEAMNTDHAGWYTDPQSDNWRGPYRHHMKKRATLVEQLLSGYSGLNKRPLIGLDLGCGDGEWTIYLKKYISHLYASDYNLHRLARAYDMSGVKALFMADITDYPAADSCFDVIFFNHVLEHIPDDDTALSEVYRILKPGGMVILGVPNEGAFFWQLAYKLQPKILANSDHQHFYTAALLKKKCMNVGFTVKEIYPIGWGVPHWWLDSKIRNYKWIDDLLEAVGREIVPGEATSLYIALGK